MKQIIWHQDFENRSITCEMVPIFISPTPKIGGVFKVFLRFRRGIFKMAVKKIAQRCQTGIMQFLVQDIPNMQKTQKNIICTLLPGSTLLPPDYKHQLYLTIQGNSDTTRQ